MARFYAPFDPEYTNSTLENTFNYNRRWIAGGASASSATQRNGLITSRSVLSGQVLSQLDAANTFVTSTRGIIVPSDGITFGGGNMSWNNVYSGSLRGLKYESDPSVRISQSISINDTSLIGGVSPADSVSILQGYYYSASAAVNETVRLVIFSGSASLTLGGPYDRVGNYPSRTLHSLYHDYQLTYFAWDDFTPGTPRSTILATPANISNEYYYTNPFNISLGWSSTNYEFKNDALARPVVKLEMISESVSGPVTVTSSGDMLLLAGESNITWSIANDPLNNGSLGGIGTYQLSASVKFRDHTLFLSESINSDGTASNNTGTLILRRLFPRSYKYLASGFTQGASCTQFSGATTTYYTWKNSALSGGEFIYTSTDTNNPGGAANGFYLDVGPGAGEVYEIQSNGFVEPIIKSCVP